jgi:hypothetical protein
VAQRVELLLIAGPLSGRRVSVDHILDNEVFHLEDERMLLCYERDADSLNYFFSAEKTAWFNSNYELAMLRLAPTLQRVAFE